MTDEELTTVYVLKFWFGYAEHDEAGVFTTKHAAEHGHDMRTDHSGQWQESSEHVADRPPSWVCQSKYCDYEIVAFVLDSVLVYVGTDAEQAKPEWRGAAVKMGEAMG